MIGKTEGVVMTETTSGNDRLYQDLARRLLAELASGTYEVGARLPAERELALQYNVSRPTVRGRSPASTSPPSS